MQMPHVNRKMQKQIYIIVNLTLHFSRPLSLSVCVGGESGDIIKKKHAWKRTNNLIITCNKKMMQALFYVIFLPFWVSFFFHFLAIVIDVFHVNNYILK